MNRLVALLVTLGLLSLIGCRSGARDPEERLLRSAFQAIRGENWEEYARLTITPSDFILREYDVNRFQEKQSFAGGVLKPGERARQKAEFLRATRGGPGLIDFKRSRFRGSGALVDQGELELLSGGSVPFKTYSIRVDGGLGHAGPHFVVVPWKKQPRLLRLAFPGVGA